MRYTHEQLSRWKEPASDSEETKIDNTKRMIRDAINNHEILKLKNMEIIVQGSYSNNTNIKQDSDIDISVMLMDTFYTTYKEGMSDKDYGFIDGTNKFSDYKNWIHEAMINKFGRGSVKIGNKSIQINSNSYRVNADIVPSFQYRNYKYSSNKNDYIEGIKFLSSKGETVINYPKVHYANGVDKNNKTRRRYKELVRIYKRIKKEMKVTDYYADNNIASFLIESLVWNVPNHYFINNPDWNDMLKASIIYLYNETKEDTGCKDWGEVSEYLYLFHSSRKWTRENVNVFLIQMWNFLGYA